MLSRRLLRVKVMQMVYGFNQRGDTTIREMEKELFHSISKSYELYHLILLLLTDIHTIAVNKIQIGKQKKMPLPEDLNPNTRFIDNKVLDQLIHSQQLQDYSKEKGLTWGDNEAIINTLYNKVVESELYRDYMESDQFDYDYQKRFIVKLVEKVIAQYEPLYSALEEMSIYWNDESEFIVSMVIKTLKSFEENKGYEQVLLDEFKDEEDRNFVSNLFRKTIERRKEHTELINKFSRNWDLERVAFMDIVIMQVALTEVMESFNIPLKVTFNEYIELAKHYSTPKSGLFINGILDKIVEHLAKEGKIPMDEFESIKKS